MNIKQSIKIRLGVSPSELLGLSLLAMFLSILSPSPQEARAQCSANELVKLLASDGTTSDGMGFFVAIDDDVAVVGAPFADNGVEGSDGAAYVFRFDGTSWVEEAKLVASDGTGIDSPNFGWSVGISDDIAVIGAPNDDNANGGGAGSAYVFRFDGMDWVEEVKLLSSDGEEFDQFGGAVGVSGAVAVIAAHADDDEGNGTGSAYIFRYDEGLSVWVEEAKLLASDGTGGDAFGTSAAISGTTAIVGAVGHGHELPGEGSAYIFRYNGEVWLEDAEVRASDAFSFATFGRSVSISGDAAVVGADGADSAYVFRYDDVDWLEEAILVGSDTTVNDNFGHSVSLSGDITMIGSYLDHDNGTASGSAYVFAFDGFSWSEEVKLLPSDGGPGQRFGVSVAISGESGIAGAYRDSENGNGAGAAYVFAGLSDCNDNDVLDLCDVSEGTSLDCDANDIPDECERCLGDANKDGTVGPLDVGFVLARFGCPVGTGHPGCDNADQNCDGVVDVLDMGYVLARFGPCP